jgi:putative polyhydroxyalkanoate system protein
VDGHIQVSASQIHVTAHLGFLLLAIRGTVEREIHRYLDEEFGSPKG